MHAEVFDRLAAEKLIPVIKLNRAEEALPLVDALRKGGIGVAEITFRTTAAKEAIQTLAQQRPDLLVGAGTVLSVEQLDAAVSAGASFVVSPGFNPRIVEACLQRGVPVLPGVNSPSQVEVAANYGLRVLKFFPAEISGGVAMLKAFASVYSTRFIPTGGLTQDNFAAYLRLPNVLACGGSWMVKTDYIDNADFSRITELSLAARQQLAKI